MAKKKIFTCYGCPYYYTDKGDRYPRKHCEHVDHWKTCSAWSSSYKKGE